VILCQTDGFLCFCDVKAQIEATADQEGQRAIKTFHRMFGQIGAGLTCRQDAPAGLEQLADAAADPWAHSHNRVVCSVLNDPASLLHGAHELGCDFH
jgi:hypothetical protein